MTTECYANPQCTPVDTHTEIGTPKTVTNDGALPMTGADVAIIVLIAFLLVALGAGFVHLSKMGKFRD